MRKLIYILMIWVLAISCVKETDWKLQGPVPGKLVVDAVITDEVKTQEVYLSMPAAQLNQPAIPFTGAVVLISNEDSTWTLTESKTVPGCYLTPSWFVSRLGKNYALVISKEGKIFSGKAKMLPVKPFTELRYLKDEDTGQYYIDWVANAFSSQDASMWEVLINWSGVPGYEQADSLHTHARLLFYTLPTLDVSEVFAPRMETTLFPAGAIINERRYSLTPEHAEFIREMLLETNWTGGLFSVAPANVVTNISNGALGFFGACSVYELSLTVVPK